MYGIRTHLNLKFLKQQQPQVRIHEISINLDLSIFDSQEFGKLKKKKKKKKKK